MAPGCGMNAGLGVADERLGSLKLALLNDKE